MKYRSNINTLLVILILGMVTLLGNIALADDLPFADYRTDSWYLPQTPSVTAGPVGSFFNPATWSMTDKAGADFWWNDRSIRSGLDNYGLAFGKSLGFAMNTTTFGTRDDSFKIYDYQLGLSQGSRLGSFGLAYRWSHGETDRVAREQALSLGFIGRKTRHLTLGASGILSLQSSRAQYVLDMGWRPLGRNWLTLFADWTVNDDDAFFNGGAWGAGLEVRPISGLHLGVRAREQVGGDDIDYALTAGITISDFGATVMPRYDQDGNLGATSFLVRSTPPYSGLPVATPLNFSSAPTYFPISLENKVLTYQKYRYFDEKRVAWLDLMNLLDRLEKSDRFDGVVINLAGFRGRPSLIWEFRQKLSELQAAGMEIIIHSDRLNQYTYYLASVADHLTMDRWGSVELPGMVLSRSYLKGTLEKVGVGFQEHRYFKYKSAAEALSRDSMSEADREQRQRIVDVVYELWQTDISQSRDLKEGRFDEIVDELGQLTAAEALENGLIDGYARWDGMSRWLKENRNGRYAPYLLQPDPKLYDDQWGPTVKIPVVYATGVCAMDEGINGRSTSEYMRRLVKDPNVAAVVLRADSPGGDPLPSDLVADAIRQLRKAGKPVIVSQGDVAASGGYWISMDGSQILTTPMTITGSVGVISGWVYDDGASEKMGITADAVSRGKHADLYSNVSFPLLGKLPRRPMNEEELERAEFLIRGMYKDFVTLVAKGRNMEFDKVAEIAQGRVWMGGDAVENGLCDGFGTLGDAIDMARTKAGVPDWREVEVVEYPPRKLFEFPNFFPGLPSLWGINPGLLQNLELGLAKALANDTPTAEVLPAMLPGLGWQDTDYISRIGQTPGQPLLLIPAEELPTNWKDWD